MSPDSTLTTREREVIRGEHVSRVINGVSPDSTGLNDSDERGGARIEPRENARVLRAPDGKFLPGTCGGPGRLGFGRREAIAVLDELLATTENKAKLRDALQREFDKNPYTFFRRIIMPLLPKTAVLGIEDGDGTPVLKIISGIDGDKL